MKAREKVQGAEHPYILLSMAQRAATFRDLDRLDEAEELELKILKVREKVLGKEHSDTMLGMVNLALT